MRRYVRWHPQNVVKQDSSSLFVPERLSESPAVPSGPSVESKSMMGSEDGGFIGFENAILMETGDDQINVKNAMIQKIKSKRYKIPCFVSGLKY
jgi:hypothetical protein